MKRVYFQLFILLLNCAYSLGQDFQQGAYSWTKVDLNVTTFKNGEPIFHAQSDQDWEKASNDGLPAFCYVEGDKSKGVLYNWFAVNDSRGLAPEGYRIPSVSDYEMLIASGEELKANSGWYDENNLRQSQFNSSAKGFRSYDGSAFLSSDHLNYYWTIEKGKSLYAKRFGIFAGQRSSIDEGRREDGCSVRLIRDYNVSVLPSEIKAQKTTIKPNEKLTLKLIDGALGEEAQFYWFKGQCPTSTNSSFSTGREITVSLTESTDIFVVIGKGSKINGACRKIRITVKDESIMPTKIFGEDYACVESTVNLSLKDGELCSTCDWYWYDSPNFSLAPIGQGWTISVKSSESKTFYVRSESKNTGKVTEPISKFITIYQTPPNPSGIKFLTGDKICTGDLLNCSVESQNLDASKWVWEYNGKEVEGRSLSVLLYESTTIKVSGKNLCGKSIKPIIENVTVYKKSSSPSSLVLLKERNKTMLTQRGGQLGTGANWEWYVIKKNQHEKHIGSGEKIKINPNKSATYLVKSEGAKCESKAEYRENIQRIPKPVGSNSWTPYYANSSGWLHFGNEIGLGLTIAYDKIQKWDTVNYFSKSGYDLFWNMKLHLITKEFFMLGVNGGIGAGIYTLPSDNYLYVDKNNEFGITTYSYYNYIGNFGADLLIGILAKGKAKLLVNYNQSITRNELSFSYNNGLDQNFGYSLNRESIGFGLRFGSNGQLNKSKQFDLILSLNDFVENSSFIQRTYTNLENRQVGIECNLWVHNTLKLNTGIFLSNTFKTLSTEELSIIGARFSIAFSIDRFR